MANSVGKVRSVPLPTMVLMVPAPKPAATVARASSGLSGHHPGEATGLVVNLPPRRVQQRGRAATRLKSQMDHLSAPRSADLMGVTYRSAPTLGSAPGSVTPDQLAVVLSDPSV